MSSTKRGSTQGSRRDLVLEGGIAVTGGQAGVLADAEIVIRGETIAAVGPRRARRRPHSTVIDCRDKVILPGLVNAHLHSEYLLLKGLVEDRRLQEWDDSDVYRRAWDWVRDPTNLEHVRSAYRASYLENVLGGVTLIGEFNCADAAIPASVEAMAECGLRGLPTIDIARRSNFTAIEDAGCVHALDDEEELTEDELRRAQELLASRPGVLLTMHAAETAERMVLIRSRLGRTTVDLLDARGLLGPHLILSHCIHVTPAEIERLAETRTRVVASPVAEMKLADGVSPLTRMLSLGVPVALGSDAAVCNNSCDMFLEMKTAALLQKVTHGARALTAAQALQMATLNGARALGFGERSGLLEPGRLADLITVDAGSPRMTPLIHNGHHSNVLANLVFCATASDVRDVWIGGQPIVSGSSHRVLDQAAVLADLQGAAEALHRALA